jgi:RNA polymerase sigma factor (TIGR02999 family)
MGETPETVTQLLIEWRGGRRGALDELVPLVYEELRGLARAHMSRERPGHTLQTTALVHELYGRLVVADVAWQDRAHFFAVAASAMRRILVDHARGRRRQKRGSGEAGLPLDEALDVSAQPDPLLVELDEALRRLEARDERKARALELHYFGGLSYEEISEVLGVAPSTVGADLRFAKAWIKRELGA